MEIFPEDKPQYNLYNNLILIDSNILLINTNCDEINSIQ